MSKEIQVLREQLLALMQEEPMRDYSSDSAVMARVGNMLAEQAETREKIRRSQIAKSKSK